MYVIILFHVDKKKVFKILLNSIYSDGGGAFEFRTIISSIMFHLGTKDHTLIKVAYSELVTIFSILFLIVLKLF